MDFLVHQGIHSCLSGESAFSALCASQLIFPAGARALGRGFLSRPPSSTLDLLLCAGSWVVASRQNLPALPRQAMSFSSW